jgi:hypothetical protein
VLKPVLRFASAPQFPNQRRRINREWTQPSPKRYGGQAANEREFKNRLISRPIAP